jgi:hypothetical protein
VTSRAIASLVLLGWVSACGSGADQSPADPTGGAVGTASGGGTSSTGGAAPAGGGAGGGGRATAAGGGPGRGRSSGGAPGAGGAADTGGNRPSGGAVSTGGAGASGSGGTPDASAPFEQARIDCVARVNAFRATEGKPAYERWVDGEACADQQAQADGLENSAHAHFGDCDEWAQNTCLWRRSLESIITDCLQQMWDEGPGEPFSEHGHYINMSSTEYTKVACGFYQGENGQIWASQNFK